MAVRCVQLLVRFRPKLFGRIDVAPEREPARCWKLYDIADQAAFSKFVERCAQTLKAGIVERPTQRFEANHPNLANSSGRRR
jgi:hypothetical protein